MRIKKLMAAVLAAGMTATAMFSTPASALVTETNLKFDIRSSGKNEVSITADQIAAGDITVPVEIFIPENTGVSGINLKLQVNDGEVKEDGTFGNYGFKLKDAAFANPFCFDSASKGDASKSLSSVFNADTMNIIWVYSQDYSKNADASAEAGTYAWNSSASWAYTTAFAKANLIVPKGTKAGDYTLDIRTEVYDNILTNGEKSKPCQSTCSSGDSETALKFTSVPLTVKIADESSKPPVSGDPWKKDYSTADSKDQHYLIVGDVSARPGETVSVPVYVYNDKGTSGMQIHFGFDKTALTFKEFTLPAEDVAAYTATALGNAKNYPASYGFAQAYTEEAEQGSILTYLTFEVPETAKAATYPIYFEEFGAPDKSTGEKKETKFIGENPSVKMDVKRYNGSITILTSDDPTINFSEYKTDKVGDTVSLDLFNVKGDVTWSSSDEKVATVDQNGFVKTVGDGTAVITAKAGDSEYKCDLTVGGSTKASFGDVAENFGEVDLSDAMVVLKSYTQNMGGKGHTLSAELLPYANVSGIEYDTDGKEKSIEEMVDLTDAMMILRYATLIQGGKVPSWYAITKNPAAPDAPQA